MIEEIKELLRLYWDNKIRLGTTLGLFLLCAVAGYFLIHDSTVMIYSLVAFLLGGLVVSAGFWASLHFGETKWIYWNRDLDEIKTMFKLKEEANGEHDGN